jgi:uncharacterized RDD family membrane protein YckC
VSEIWTYSLHYGDQRIELEVGEHILGRSKVADVSVPEKSVSRQHARLTLKGGRIVVKDLGSSNGTYINNVEVEDSAEIVHGDELALGDAEMGIRIEANTFQTIQMSATSLASAEIPAAMEAPAAASSALSAPDVPAFEAVESELEELAPIELGPAPAAVELDPLIPPPIEVAPQVPMREQPSEQESVQLPPLAPPLTVELPGNNPYATQLGGLPPVTADGTPVVEGAQPGAGEPEVAISEAAVSDSLGFSPPVAPPRALPIQLSQDEAPLAVAEDAGGVDIVAAGEAVKDVVAGDLLGEEAVGGNTANDPAATGQLADPDASQLLSRLDLDPGMLSGAAAIGATAGVAAGAVRGSSASPQAAGFGRRLAAFFLDALWMSALSLAGSLLAGRFSAAPVDLTQVPDLADLASLATSPNALIASSGAILAMLVILLGWAFPGTTPGKRLLGLYVCTMDGQAGIGLLRSLVRYLGYLLSCLTFGIGFLMIAFTASKRGLHDLLAGTYVARK